MAWALAQEEAHTIQLCNNCLFYDLAGILPTLWHAPSDAELIQGTALSQDCWGVAGFQNCWKLSHLLFCLEERNSTILTNLLYILPWILLVGFLTYTVDDTFSLHASVTTVSSLGLVFIILLLLFQNAVFLLGSITFMVTCSCFES